jgi:putative DNA primase/helicase
MDGVISQFQSAGLIVDGAPTIGRFERCRVDGDKGQKKSGWYILHEMRLDSGDVVFVGRYGNWKLFGDEGIAVTFDAKVSPLDRERIAKQQAYLREAAEVDRKLRAQAAASRARGIWDQLPESGTSEYLARKRVLGFGVRFSRGGIVVPVRDVAGTLAGLQFIYADGSKKFLTGTAKRGCFHRIGSLSPDAPLCVCEGYATGASIHMATGWPVAIAFDAGNLSPVAQALHDKYAGKNQYTRIVICADNDSGTAGNPGITKATAAAQLVGGVVAVPQFDVGVAA